MQSDIVGINDIFRDLATLVNEQGEVIGKGRWPFVLVDKCILVCIRIVQTA